MLFWIQIYFQDILRSARLYNRMIDRIMEMREYRFYCHEQIKIELARDNIGESSVWLDDKISKGYIHCTTDEEIMDELHAIYSNSAEAMYMGYAEDWL